jgi:hypothetical protein
MKCPTLLNAIFALSSRHLSMHEQFDEYASTRYHQNCLRELSTVSNDSSALNNDDLLAATILLRTLEELDGEPSRPDPPMLHDAYQDRDQTAVVGSTADVVIILQFRF